MALDPELQAPWNDYPNFPPYAASDQDFKTWFLTTPWPTMILQQYPQLVYTMQNPKSVFNSSLAESEVLPYSIDTPDEMELHHKIRSTSIKEIWKWRSWEDDVSWLHQIRWYPNALGCAVYPRSSWTRATNRTCSGCPYFTPYHVTYYDPSWGAEMARCRPEICPCWICTRRYVKKCERPRSPVKEQCSLSAGNVAELYRWLETTHPKRHSDFTSLVEAGNYFERIANQLRATKSEIESVSPGSPPEVETVFDELEREALAQYRASDTSLSILPILEVLSPEQETRLQDLEREALEQYDQTCGDDLERAADLQESQETMSPALKRKRETPVEEVKEVELFEEVPEPKKERGKKYSRIRLLSSCSRPATLPLPRRSNQKRPRPRHRKRPRPPRTYRGDNR